MRCLLNPALWLLALSASHEIPQQPSAPLNELCSIHFDADDTISSDSFACLNLLATTLKVSPQMQLLLTGSAAHNTAIANYLISQASVSASSIRTSITSAEPDSVRTSLVKPLPLAMPIPVAEAYLMAAPKAVAAARSTITTLSRTQPAQKPYTLGEQAAAWKDSLKSGAIEYNVPPVMIAQRASTVYVIVHGANDRSSTVLASIPGSSGATIKVSDTMQIDLIGSPTEFTITPQATPAAQPIPTEGYATWMERDPPEQGHRRAPCNQSFSYSGCKERVTAPASLR